MTKMRNAYRILIRTPKKKSQSGRPALRWKDNIKMGYNENRYEDVEWVYLTWTREQ
jgi:hypothetical protein